jgi:predicted MFS family arabinose efflux permease
MRADPEKGGQLDTSDDQDVCLRPKDEEAVVEEINGHNQYSPHDGDNSNLARLPTTGSQAKATIARTLSLVRTREAEAGPPPDGGIRAWSQVVLAHLVMCNTWGYINGFGVFQTYYTEALNRPPSDISWIGSVETFLVFFIGTFSGRATDAGYFKVVWATGATIAVFSIFMTSLCTQYWQLLLSQGILQGLGCGLMFCPTLSLIPTYFDKRRAVALACVATGSATGGLLFPGIFNALLPKIGFAWTMRALGLFTFTTLLPSAFFLRQRLSPRKTGPIVDWASFKELPYTLFGIGMYLAFWGLYVGFFYISSFAHNAVGASVSTSTDMLMIMSAVGIVARVIPGLISDRWTGPLNLLIPFTFASAIVCYGWAGVDSIGGLYAFSPTYGVVTAAVQGLFPVAVSSLTTDLKKIGVRIGMILSILSFSALTGNPIAGALVQVDNGRYLYMQMFMGSAMMVGGVCLLGARIARFGLARVRG